MKSSTKRLHVTSEILKEAVREDSSHCMYAQALRMGGASSVNVTAEKIRWNEGGFRHFTHMPPRGAQTLLQFEDGMLIMPHEMVIQGRDIFFKPVELRPHAKKRGPTRKHQKHLASKVVRSKRRFAGLQILTELPA